MNKEELIKKWEPIINNHNIGMTGSQLSENKSNQNLQENTTKDEFPSLLPLAIKVASRTISSELIFVSKEEINNVKNKVKSENRDGKIEAIVEGGEFIEKKLEDDEEYKELMKRGVTPLSAPSSGALLYIDFKYEEHKS